METLWQVLQHYGVQAHSVDDIPISNGGLDRRLGSVLRCSNVGRVHFDNLGKKARIKLCVIIQNGRCCCLPEEPEWWWAEPVTVQLEGR